VVAARVAKRTIAAWSPGEAPVGVTTEIATPAAPCGPSTTLRGRRRSHATAGPRRAATSGLPRPSTAKPAARASTVAAALPPFLIVSVRLAAPVSRIRTGETESAAAAAPVATAITVRSP
jgi:hypothetical protein